MIVVDTNVVVKLVLRSADSEQVERLFALEPLWVAPRLVRSEIMSVLAQQARRAGLDAAEASEACAVAFDAFDDTSLEPEPRRVLDLAARSGCSSYDCEYVAVAEELGCRLATFDRQVLRRFPEIAATPASLTAGR
ncbi:MAG: type II toxin-antitoxin system VapC family toxin [Gemmatimonadaceae bacterium]|nr:type II toxin-antitoxin system VapC family toxin [Gemmatimonadaceae bacterium]